MTVTTQRRTRSGVTSPTNNSPTKTNSILWEFLDKFTFSDASPSDPLSADVIGSWIVVNTGDDLAVTGGAMQINGRVGGGDPRLTSSSQTRSVGLATFYKVLTPSAADGHVRFGFDKITTGTNLYQSFRIQQVGLVDCHVNGATFLTGAAGVSDDVDIFLAIVLRATGAYYFVKGGNRYSNWTLLFVDDSQSDATLHTAFTPATAGMTRGQDTSMAGISQLGGIWVVSEFGIVTQRLAGSRSAGNTFNHDADFFAELVVTTLPSSGTIDFFFRIQDATNYWQITVDSVGDIDLDEIVAGTPTERGTSAAAITAGERVCLWVRDERISVFDSSARLINYTSAANFKTETSGELDSLGTGGAVDDIITWPIDNTLFNFNRFFVGA